MPPERWFSPLGASWRRLFLRAVTGRMLPLTMKILVLLLLPLPLSQAAPKDGTMRLVPEEQHLPLPNPFQPGQEQLRLLQSYLKGLEKMEEEPEHMSREQVLLYLFALHDYDQSGQLDGLELLSMLTAALAPGAADSPTTNPSSSTSPERPPGLQSPKSPWGHKKLRRSLCWLKLHQDKKYMKPWVLEKKLGDRWRSEGSPRSLYRRLRDRQRLKKKPQAQEGRLGDRQRPGTLEREQRSSQGKHWSLRTPQMSLRSMLFSWRMKRYKP
ncbi:cell growth regulator with EF hand domain protein 1 isoform X2 [Vicugna pacos]|uniref:Cell growth regulator with EF hand domain protein 1 isoform X2 n=1 Tax=Vicugna pacos TaxID=30538 RepID=A0ABM5BCN0_VICPA